jgi:uncharacterized protein
MALLHASGPDVDILELFEQSGRNVARATELLRDVATAWPEATGLVAELVACEHDGDRIARAIIHRLHEARDARGAAGAVEGHRLAKALDDIVDDAEETADMFGLYRVEAPMEQSTALAEVLAGAGTQVALALTALRKGGDPGPCLLEIERLENEGDRLSRDAIAALFEAGIDPMVVIRWKDIFESLEAAIDACAHAAHVLEGIRLDLPR